MKRNYNLIIRGKEHEWTVSVMADPEHVKDWQADGLQLEEVQYSVPAWAVEAGLLKPYIFIYDLFYMRNPFRK